jgi:AcrR family transcriptional regulator
MSDLRDSILDAAKKRFDRFGFKKTTLDEIARDLKISKKTIYEHFTDKEDLFITLFIAETLAARNKIFESIPIEMSPVDKLKTALDRGIAYFGKDTFLVRVLRDDGNLYSPFLTTKYHELVEEGIIRIIADILAEGKAQGLFRDVDEQTTAYYLFRLFQAVSYARTTEFEQGKDAAQGLIDLIFHGIVKQYNVKC